MTAVDNLSALGRVPRADETVSRAGVSEYVDLVFAPDGYLWWMLQQIESGTSERFSLIYLDGSHSWFIDGFAVNLLSHFLKEGGYLILDDLDWTFEDPEVRNSEIARGMSAEARAVPHIRQVWELLILADPGWGEFEEINDWGIARRVQASEQRGKVEKVVVRRTLREEVGALTAEVGHRLRR